MSDRTSITLKKLIISFSALAAVTACSQGENTAASSPDDAADEQASSSPSNTEILDTVLADDRRSQEERARDAFRHPKQTLSFFGVEPSMTVVEVWPGGGWYTNVIAPYIAAGGGSYYAAQFAAGDNEYYTKMLEQFTTTYTTAPDEYGAVTVTTLQPSTDSETAATPIAPEGSVDAVLTFRNAHNWMEGGYAEDFFSQFYTALKPGGVLGVVDHRANADTEEKLETGYVSEASVIALAEGAGFVLEERSEINANAADTKDHPFGVWTLPPVRRSSPAAGVEPAADFDRAKYDAIGESDRMTLRFRKPAAE